MSTETDQPAPVAAEEQRIREIHERLAKATPGKWLHFGNKHKQPDDEFGGWSVDSTAGSRAIARGPNVKYIDNDGEQHPHSVITDNCYFKNDAEFIAHAREDVPWLLAERDRLAAALREAEERGRLAVEVAEAATKFVEYAGAFEIPALRRLMQVLESERSKCRAGDNRDYWGFLRLEFDRLISKVAAYRAAGAGKPQARREG